MAFKCSLIALVLSAGVAGCVANTSSEATSFLPGTDTQSPAVRPGMAAVPSGVTWWGEPISDAVTIETRSGMTWWNEPINDVVAVVASANKAPDVGRVAQQLCREANLTRVAARLRRLR